MPTFNGTFRGSEYQDFVLAAPFDGTAHIVNNGAFSVYIKDTVTNIDYKVRFGESGDVPIVNGRPYTILVCGDVSITYNLIKA